MQSDWDFEATLTGAAIGAVSGAAGYGAGAWAFGAVGGEGASALLAGGIVGGAAGGATYGGLNAAVYGGNIGDAMVKWGALGGLGGFMTGGLLASGVHPLLAVGVGGFTSGFFNDGLESGAESAAYSVVAYAVSYGLKRISGPGSAQAKTDGKAGNAEAQHRDNARNALNPDVAETQKVGWLDVVDCVKTVYDVVMLQMECRAEYNTLGYDQFGEKYGFGFGGGDMMWRCVETKAPATYNRFRSCAEAFTGPLSPIKPKITPRPRYQ